MTLVVDWSKVTPPPTDQEKESSAFSVGISMLVTGVPRLETVAHVQEHMVRLALYDALHGPMLRNAAGENLGASITFWRRWASVRVNCVTLTRNAFVKRITTTFLQDVEYKLRQEM